MAVFHVIAMVKPSWSLGIRRLRRQRLDGIDGVDKVDGVDSGQD
jgi:hypothetical protein